MSLDADRAEDRQCAIASGIEHVDLAALIAPRALLAESGIEDLIFPVDAARETIASLRHCASLPLNPQHERPYVAVATLEGVLVNQHLGEAEQVYIYGNSPKGASLVSIRPTPERGSGNQRWSQLAAGLVVARAESFGGSVR